MKKLGIVLILAGISLLVVLSMNVSKKKRSMLAFGDARREIALIRWVTAASTVLIITGVSFTVLTKRP